jgi:integrase
MAYYTKREGKKGISYLITQTEGYSADGTKQKRQTMTWKPDKGMTAKQIEKELSRQLRDFEKSCEQGQKVTAKIKFETFAEEWLEKEAANNLKAMTLHNYRTVYSKVAYKAIGHKKLCDINHGHIEDFAAALRDGGKYRPKGLSQKSIKNYVSFVSSVFEYARRRQILTHNPCSTVKLKVERKVIDSDTIYTADEMKLILGLLHQEDSKDIRFKVYFTLAVFSGFRRAEMLGLEWKDVDFDRQIISVKRTSNYISAKGVYEDTPKTNTSFRTIKIPHEVMGLLKQYQKHQAEYAESLGNKWEGTGRLFTTAEGKPMFITTPRHYFKTFCERHGIRYLNLHSMRHFNASAMIDAGVDVKAVQVSLGHSQASTTMNIYAHAFQKVQAAAADSITSAIGIPNMGT